MQKHMKDKNAHNKILKMMRKEYDAMKDKVESEVHSPARVQRSLMSQITTGNMEQYHRVVDNYPDCATPTNSGISTPLQNT